MFVRLFKLDTGSFVRYIAGSKQILFIRIFFTTVEKFRIVSRVNTSVGGAQMKFHQVLYISFVFSSDFLGNIISLSAFFAFF